MKQMLQPVNDWKRENFTRLPKKMFKAMVNSGDVVIKEIGGQSFVVVEAKNEQNLLNKILQA